MSAKPEDKYVRVGGFNTRFWSMGERGSAVVFVHGLGGSLEDWALNIAPLAQHHPAYAFDLLGFGRTDKFHTAPPLKEWTRFIKDFLDSQGIDQAHLIGNSLGGGLSLRFAVEFPERIGKLVLVNAAGLGRDVSRIVRLLYVPLLGEMLGRPSRKGTERLLSSIVYDRSVLSEEMVDTAYRLARQPGAQRCLLSTLRLGATLMGQSARFTRSTIDGMSQVTAPTLIIWGKQDAVLPVSQADVAAHGIPNAELHLLDRCGHVPQLEQPDEVNNLLREFLAD